MYQMDKWTHKVLRHHAPISSRQSQRDKRSQLLLQCLEAGIVFSSLSETRVISNIMKDSNSSSSSKNSSSTCKQHHFCKDAPGRTVHVTTLATEPASTPLDSWGLVCVRVLVRVQVRFCLGAGVCGE